MRILERPTSTKAPSIASPRTIIQGDRKVAPKKPCYVTLARLLLFLERVIATSLLILAQPSCYGQCARMFDLVDVASIPCNAI